MPVPVGDAQLGDGFVVRHDMTAARLVLTDVRSGKAVTSDLAALPAAAFNDRGISWSVDKYGSGVAYVDAGGLLHVGPDIDDLVVLTQAIHQLAGPVGERRTQRTGDDVGHPKRGDAVQAKLPARQRGDQDDDRKEDARVQIAEVQGVGGEVSQRRPESKGREYRGPVVGLTTLGRDAVDRQRALVALPNPEDRG